ncbi:MAG: hypothetical protein M3O15_14605, partial [Acidobacteriota bacterium]|nr:hypothetical protein [Acidobacteriota bacterium]
LATAVEGWRRPARRSASDGRLADAVAALGLVALAVLGGRSERAVPPGPAGAATAETLSRLWQLSKLGIDSDAFPGRSLQVLVADHGHDEIGAGPRLGAPRRFDEPVKMFLCRSQQIFAFPGSFGLQQGIEACDQPFSGKL